MAADAPAPPSGGSNLPKILIAVAAIAAIVVLLFVTGVIGGGSDDDEDKPAEAQSTEEIVKDLREGSVLAGNREVPFAMRYTDDWEQLSADDLSEGNPRPVAGLRRKDRSAVLTVTARGPVRGGISSLQDRLPDELKRRFPDMRLQTIELIRVAGGPALYTSWVRTKSGRVQSSLVVPVGNKRSFTVDTVLNPDASDAAAEVAQMLRSFDTAQTG